MNEHLSSERSAGIREDFRASGRLSGSGRLRVVHFVDSFEIGGTELNAIRTMEGLSRGRFELSLGCLNDDGPLRGRYAEAKIPITCFPVPSFRGPTAVRRAIELIQWFRQTRPYAVHCHDRYTNAFVAPCARLSGVPLLITSKRWWTAMPKLGYGLANRFAYQLSDLVVANSQAVARLLIDVERVAASKVRVIPNFVDDSAFDALSSDELRQIRTSFGIPAEAVVGTAVAKFRPEKDLMSLICATAQLSQRCPTFHLLLVGSGPCEMPLRDAVRDLGVTDRVHFAGLLRAPPNPHQFGDFSLLCSLHEAFPNTVIEAMAAARPVIATAVGGVPEAVEHEVTGLLLPPSAPAPLVSAMERLINDAQLRLTLGAAARDQAKRKYSGTQVIEQLTNMYLGRADTASVRL